MSFRLLSLAFATALVFVAGPASAARIIVTIDGLKNAQGNVFIGLYASPAKWTLSAQCSPLASAFAKDRFPPNQGNCERTPNGGFGAIPLKKSVFE